MKFDGTPEGAYRLTMAVGGIGAWSNKTPTSLDLMVGGKDLHLEPGDEYPEATGR